MFGDASWSGCAYRCVVRTSRCPSCACTCVKAHPVTDGQGSAVCRRSCSLGGRRVSALPDVVPVEHRAVDAGEHEAGDPARLLPVRAEDVEHGRIERHQARPVSLSDADAAGIEVDGAALQRDWPSAAREPRLDVVSHEQTLPRGRPRVRTGLSCPEAIEPAGADRGELVRRLAVAPP